MTVTPERTLENVLQLMRTDEVLTAEAKQLLVTAAGTCKVSDLVAHDAGSLAEFLYAADSNLTTVCDLLAVSARLLEAFGQASTTASAATTAAASLGEAIRVQVELPRTIGDMSLTELLELLVAAPPDRTDEILTYLQLIPQVVLANDKLASHGKERGRWAVVVDGKLDVDKTASYVARLAQKFTQPQETLDDGVRPTTISKAMGSESRPYIHPFTGQPVVGPDDLGFDFSQLSDELHCALIWGLLTKHPAWPGTVDRFTISEEVFKTKLPRRWQLILDAYRAAKLDNDDTALRVTRHFPTSQLSGAGESRVHGLAAEPAQDEQWYRRQLEGIAEAAQHTASGSIRLGRTVVMGLSAASGSIELSGTIVLSSIRIASGSIRGMAYVPSGCGVNMASGSRQAEIYPRPYKALYEIAQGYGLI